MTHLKTPALLSILVMALAACSSTPMAPTTEAKPMTTMAATPAAPAQAQHAGAMAAAAPSSSVKTVNVPPYLDPHNSLSTARSVFFDFDDAAVKPEFNGLVEQHGKYLAANPALHIRIEGNTDERGSAEYNLALGQKRAQAVSRALQIYGVREGQVEAVSWGDEKPKVSEHDESAWAQNRRADLRYPSK